MSGQGSALTLLEKVQRGVTAMLISSRLQVSHSLNPNLRHVATLSIDLGLTADDSAIGARMQAKFAF
jgi:hypothetical protein